MFTKLFTGILRAIRGNNNFTSIENMVDQNEPTTVPHTSDKSNSKIRSIVIIVSVFIMLVLLGIGLYFYMNNVKSNPTDTTSSVSNGTTDTSTSNTDNQNTTAVVDAVTPETLTLPPELQLEVASIADSVNAYDNFKKAAEAAEIKSTERETATSVLKGEIWDQAFIDTVRAENSEALDILSEAVNKAGYQNPNTASASVIEINLTDTPINPSSLTMLNSLIALDDMHYGRGDLAMQRMLSYLKLAHLMNRSQDSTLAYLVSLNIFQDTLLNLQTLISTREVDRELLLTTINELGSYTNNSDGAISGIAIEYYQQAM